MHYAHIQLHAPEPPRPRETDEKRDRNNPYPDFEQSFIVEDEDKPRREDSHIVVIDL